MLIDVAKANILLRRFLGLDPQLKKDVKLRTVSLGKKGAEWSIEADFLNRNSKIYTFGIGEDLSFEEKLVSKFGLKIWAFDPTPRSIAWSKRRKFSPHISIYPFGISERDGFAYFKPPKKKKFVSYKIIRKYNKEHGIVKLPVFRLSTIMKKLHHKKIDVLKLDIEGAEYKVIPDILKCKLEISHILVEFHHKLQSYSARDTEVVADKLKNFNYKIYHISKSRTEYSFIKV